MSNRDELTKINHAGSPPTPSSNAVNPTVGVSTITRRWKMVDLLNKVSLVLRGLAFFFYLISFIIMASNKHLDWKISGRYSQYRYLLAIASISILYTGGKACGQVFRKQIFDQRNTAIFDFLGDQIVALVCLLISSSANAIPLTISTRDGKTFSLIYQLRLCHCHCFRDSGYKFSLQSYI